MLQKVALLSVLVISLCFCSVCFAGGFSFSIGVPFVGVGYYSGPPVYYSPAYSYGYTYTYSYPTYNYIPYSYSYYPAPRYWNAPPPPPFWNDRHRGPEGFEGPRGPDPGRPLFDQPRQDAPLPLMPMPHENHGPRGRR